MSRGDIFDRLFTCRLLLPLAPLWKRHRAVLLYLFFGGLTTVVSIGSFWLFHGVLHWNEHIANTGSWLLAVLFAFLTNRLWVFQAPTKGLPAFLRQMLRFYGGRLATFAAEELLVLVFITRLGFPALAVKIAAQVVVLILNYIVSKCFVFNPQKADRE